MKTVKQVWDAHTKRMKSVPDLSKVLWGSFFDCSGTLFHDFRVRAPDPNLFAFSLWTADQTGRVPTVASSAIELFISSFENQPRAETIFFRGKKDITKYMRTFGIEKVEFCVDDYEGEFPAITYFHPSDLIKILKGDPEFQAYKNQQFSL